MATHHENQTCKNSENNNNTQRRSSTIITIKPQQDSHAHRRSITNSKTTIKTRMTATTKNAIIRQTHRANTRSTAISPPTASVTGKTAARAITPPPPPATSTSVPTVSEVTLKLVL